MVTQLNAEPISTGGRLPKIYVPIFMFSSLVTAFMALVVNTHFCSIHLNAADIMSVCVCMLLSELERKITCVEQNEPENSLGSDGFPLMFVVTQF